MVTAADLEARLCQCLAQHCMPDCFLYLGPAGMARWLELSRSEDFPVAARLTQLLKQQVRSLVRHVPAGSRVVGIGVGSGEKERLLLDALVERGTPAYYAVDVSGEMVDTALETVAHLRIEKVGVVALLEDLPQIRSLWASPVLLCLLGNSFCNYEPDGLLAGVHRELAADDLFLFDCHLFHAGPDGEEGTREEIEHVYRSGPNVRFNLGPLVERGLHPDDCLFLLDLLDVDTSVGAVRKTSKSIQVLRDTSLRCGAGTVSLAAGDVIRLGFTCKYTRAQVESYLDRHGFQRLELLVSPSGDNLLALVRRRLLDERQDHV